MSEVERLYRFDRYWRGGLMAMGVRVFATSEAEALEKAKRVMHPLDGDEFELVEVTPSIEENR